MPRSVPNWCPNNLEPTGREQKQKGISNHPVEIVKSPRMKHAAKRYAAEGEYSIADNNESLSIADAT